MTSLSESPVDLDAWLDRHVGVRLSLCPGRERPTPFAELFCALELDRAREYALREVSERLVQAIAYHYPDNVFWDLDRLVSSLATRVSTDAIRSSGERLERLMAGFGMHSEIRFRYVHDFTYGFDWAKWVARAPEEREYIGPFDDAFLIYLEQRQRELMELIARDDEKYGKLRGDAPRNPFAFSREPEDERRLHEALAASGHVPVLTWTFDGRDRWGARFSEERDRVAKGLGLER